MEFLSGHKPPQRQCSVRVLITETHYTHALLRPLVCVSRRRFHIWGAAAAPLRLMELSSRSLSVQGLRFLLLTSGEHSLTRHPFAWRNKQLSRSPSSYFTQVHIEKTRRPKWARNIFWSTAFCAFSAAPLNCSRMCGVGNFNEFSYFNYASGRRWKKVPSAALKSRVLVFCNCSAAALAPNLR